MMIKKKKKKFVTENKSDFNHRMFWRISILDFRNQ